MPGSVRWFRTPGDGSPISSFQVRTGPVPRWDAVCKGIVLSCRTPCVFAPWLVTGQGIDVEVDVRQVSSC